MELALKQEQQAAQSEGWQAGIDIELVNFDGHTRMGRTRHYGPLRIQRPFWPEGKDLTHLYILHPPGGLVAGDELTQCFKAQKGAAGLITTPAAGKVYFNGNGRLQKQLTQLSIQDDASLEWLPQETILFNGAVTELNTTVELEGSGRYAGWDIICLGRKASGESFLQGEVTQNLLLQRDGRPLYRERLHLKAGSPLQNSLLGLNGHHVYGTFLLTLNESPDCDVLQAWLEEENWQNQLAITWRAGVMIARYLGDSPEQARNVFTALWQKLRPQFNNRPVCQPRIWNT